MEKFDVINFLDDATVDGNVIKLPSIVLERNHYMVVKKKLEAIGGKWKGGKIQGFIFDYNPSKILHEIVNGKNIDFKKDYQFFETPDDIAEKIVMLADISRSDVVLEPSAGRGAIIKQIHKLYPNKNIDCFEIMELNKSFLEKIENIDIIGDDFLKCNIDNHYDKIIANPTFKNNQDIEHIRKMYDCLKINGRLVSISSNHWTFCQNRTEKDFRKWLESIDSEIIKLPSNTFKKSGSNIESCILIINKLHGK